MGSRLLALLSPLPLLVLFALGATAAGTWAAGQQLQGAAPTTPTTTAPPQLATLVVPDVTQEAYVFAKEQLQDDGFAWRVAGAVQGFAANTVVAQTPSAGTKLIDTGAPTITLTLTRNSGYLQKGEPQEASPYLGTVIHVVGAPAAATSHEYPQKRPVAFVVPGAKAEPLDQPPLPDLAKQLGRWLAGHGKPTKANLRHWRAENAKIVAGAKLGWWRGAEALHTLVSVDTRALRRWNTGGPVLGTAKSALAEVGPRSK